jgi:hypothetical protein
LRITGLSVGEQDYALDVIDGVWQIRDSSGTKRAEGQCAP